MAEELNISPEVMRAKQRFMIIGNSPLLITAIDRALQVAPIDLSVLIIGESGSGKEFFPNIIHENSPRKHRRYIAVNCGAIPEGTIDSELFGHEKGAFTGAVTARKGYFEEADGGTIFLDEVAELPMTTQARLLRVLESGEYLKVGSSEVQKTNIRIVAATNKNMIEAVQEGKFREDLYYRLSTVQINVPPLRQRGNDILLLTRKFSNDFAERYRTPGVKFADSAKEAMLAYRWPGNVRQLKNVVEQMALFEAGNEVTREQVKRYLPDYSTSYMPAVTRENSKFDYSMDRDMIFKLIMKMQQEIEDLRDAIGEKKTHAASESLPHSPAALPSPESFATKEAASIEIMPDAMPHREPHANAHKSHNYVDYAVIDSVHEDVTEAEPVAVAPRKVQSLEETEKEMIMESLKRNGANRKRTAEELGISERTLYRKIQTYGLG